MRILMLLKVLERLSVINSKYFIRTHRNRTASFTLKKKTLENGTESKKIVQQRSYTFTNILKILYNPIEDICVGMKSIGLTSIGHHTKVIAEIGLNFWKSIVERWASSH